MGTIQSVSDAAAANPVTSKIADPIPVPTYGPGGHFSVISKTTIPVIPIKVLNLIRDTTTWPTWNTFCPAGEISPKSVRDPKASTDPDLPSGNEGWLDLGTMATVDVFMSGDGLVEGRKRDRTQDIVITHLEKMEKDGRHGYRIAWKSTGWAHWQLHSERVMEFTEYEIEGGAIGTDYVCWETFGGLLARGVKAAKGSQLVERFGDYSRDVRDHFLHQQAKGKSSDGS